MPTNSIFIILFCLGILSCGETKPNSKKEPPSTEIKCSDQSCHGVYIGAEFINGSDIAHQHSNKMSAAVGDQLKLLYKQGKYVKVDFPNVKMTTVGMGSGTVTYELTIPFIPVSSKCKAYTSFDHVGGWNHAPELKQRKKALSAALMHGDELDISQLKKTKEGLEEYWIQWRNKETQKSCLDKLD